MPNETDALFAGEKAKSVTGGSKVQSGDSRSPGAGAASLQPVVSEESQVRAEDDAVDLRESRGTHR